MIENFDIFNIISNNVKPDKGKVLISEPLLNDKHFVRSVVLLAAVEADGSLGFVLNNPTSKKLHELVDGINEKNIPVYFGGPVEKDVLFCIHCVGSIPGSIHIFEDVYLSGNFDYIKKLINKRLINNSNSRFFVGNSGWGAYQLNDEINFNYWLVSAINKDFIFSEPETQWKRALDFVDPKYEIWKNFPLNPEEN